MALSPALHSNAFNFMDFIQRQVDPRTGQYTCAVSLPELKANNLSGPVVPLQLGFNSLNTADSGFGKGWTLQLSQYDPTNRILSLYTGESFKVNHGAKGFSIPEKKLDSFHFSEVQKDNKIQYRIEHKSGLVEILEKRQGQLALPVEMHSPQGHRVQLNYIAFNTTPLLSSIRNDDGTPLLTLERSTNTLTLVLYPDTPYSAQFVFAIKDGLTRSIALPTDDLASWRFDYSPQDSLTCLKSVHTPGGSHETVVYSGTSHQFPASNGRKLPRVESHKVDPGFGQPVIENRYAYDNDDYNFLGFGSDIAWTDDGLDNLYKVVQDYHYETRESLWDTSRNTAVRTTRRVYNRFHLTVLEEVTQHAASSPQSDTQQLTETEYYLEKDLPFQDQPAYCQLPRRVRRTWLNVSAIDPRHTEITTSTYDTFGNPLIQVHADGVSETCEWYSAAGEEGCPADPLGFVRLLKSRTITPAASDYGDAPVLQTRFRYRQLAGLQGTPPSIVLSDESVHQVLDGKVQAPLKHTTHTYIEDSADPMRHGRLARLTHTVNGQAGTRTVTEYSYATHTLDSHAGLPVLRTISTQIGFDDTAERPIRKVITQDHALHNGLLLRSSDDNQGEVLYEYDRLQRALRETVSPGTDYQASRTFSYALTNGAPGQQAWRTSTTVNGVITRTWLDGLNRVLREERLDKDGLGGDTQAFRPIYQASYNHLGQLTQEISTDWEGSKNVELSTTFEYDTWGQQYKAIGADGVAHVTENDPTRQTLRTWTQNASDPSAISGMNLSTLNRFGKQDKVEALDAQRAVIGKQQFRYDGLGNCVEEVDAMGNTTRYHYDLFARVQATTLPTLDRIERSYAAHSLDELPVQLQVFNAGDTPEAPGITVGTQTFDGLNRVSSVDVGARRQLFRYKGSQAQAVEVITPSKQQITYQYTPALVDSPVGSKAPGQQSSFDYDNASAQLIGSQNEQGKYSFTYTSAGHLLSEQWQDIASGKKWQTNHTQTLAGRPLTRLDSNGMQCSYTYDDKGRPKSVTQGTIVAVFEYDSLGRAHIISTRDQSSNNLVQTTVNVDDQGRETRRQIVASGQPTYLIEQTYQADNKLKTRQRQRDGLIELLESFVYDPRGRMTEYRCTGEDLPKDRAGNAFTAQYFSFDALDNVSFVITEFADGKRDIATSTFAEHDPCQLVEISHTHPAYPERCVLEYDVDGNLLRDENGQALHYDSRGRLLRVTSSAGQVVSQYRYDAHNHLLGVRRSMGSETLRFYDGEQLVRTEQDAINTHFLYFGDQPLAQQQQDDPAKALLLLTDGKNSVLAERGQNMLRKAIYSAYGERSPDSDTQSVLGFNGEVRDEASGWYLLGRGYRAYNPGLMRFHSPDSLSPFAAGGINPYAYCAGDPINFTDPTGHFKRKTSWKGVLGGILSAIGIVLTVAAIVIAPPVGVAAITFTAAMAGVGIGFGAYGIYQGVMATEAKRWVDRKRNETEALISGALDVGFGLLDVFLAVRTAAKVAKASAHSHWSTPIPDPMIKVYIPKAKLSPTSAADELPAMNTGGLATKTTPAPAPELVSPPSPAKPKSQRRALHRVSEEQQPGDAGMDQGGGGFGEPDGKGGWRKIDQGTDQNLAYKVGGLPAYSVARQAAKIRSLKNMTSPT